MVSVLSQGEHLTRFESRSAQTKSEAADDTHECRISLNNGQAINLTAVVAIQAAEFK